MSHAVILHAGEFGTAAAQPIARPISVLCKGGGERPLKCTGSLWSLSDSRGGTVEVEYIRDDVALVIAPCASLDTRGDLGGPMLSPYHASPKLRKLLLLELLVRELPLVGGGELGSLCSLDGCRLGPGKKGSSPGTV